MRYNDEHVLLTREVYLVVKYKEPLLSLLDLESTTTDPREGTRDWACGPGLGLTRLSDALHQVAWIWLGTRSGA